MRRRCLLFALSFLAAGTAMAADLRLQLNPALARLDAADPKRAKRVLDALDAIVRNRPFTTAEAPPRTRAIDPPVERLLNENPLLQEAWRIDPKAALTQIREIVAIGGN